LLSIEEVIEVPLELSVAVVVIALDCRLLDRPVRSLQLIIGTSSSAPGVLGAWGAEVLQAPLISVMTIEVFPSFGAAGRAD
jgi:hypothetical protein